jgi:alpha-L-fucosidase
MPPAVSIRFLFSFLLGMILVPGASNAAVTPFVHYRMGDGTPGTNGGKNLPYDSSGNGRHMASAASGTPTLTQTGGPNDDAFYTFNGSSHYFFGTVTAWDPPEDNVGVEAWVRTSNLNQVNRNIFGTGDNTVGLNIGFEANGGAGWFGAVANKAFAGNFGTGSYTAGTWIHLAVVRSAGITTFYTNGIPYGTTTAVPNNSAGSGALHMAVTSGGSSLFDGDMAEARIFTFAAGAFNPATDLLITPVMPAVVREETIATIAGTTYLAKFEVQPASGQSSVPRLSLEINGQSPLRNLSLLTALPSGATGVPYIIRFTADSAATTLRFSTLSGDSASAGQISSLAVAEPLTATPATSPNAGQQAQIDRRYGLFLHYGINTFHNEEWTDGTKPVSSYQPTALDVEQWVHTAYEAGMSYVLLISKHHDGFCVWDSPWTQYDVGSTSVPDDIIAAAAAACRKYGIRLAFYYSLWDRHEPSYANDEAYNQYMLRQLEELLGNHGPVCELWLDGGWDKANTRWPSMEIYDLVRRLQPDCQVSTNWTIGAPGNPDQAVVLPNDQQEGYPIRYFPSDFRLGDPYLPKFPDPKVFSNNGQSYYLPFEATVTLSSQNRWFYHTGDLSNKPVSQLAEYYYAATAQNNILVLNAPPDRSGRIRETERNTLIQLRDKLGLSPGVRLPRNVTGMPTATASSVWTNDVANYGPLQALDGNPTTRWASGPAGSTTASLELDFGSATTFSRILIDEFEPSPRIGRITGFRLQSWNGSDWQTFHTGTTCGRYSLHDFPQRTTNKIRLIVDSATDATSIWEFQIHDAAHAFSTWRNQHFPVNGTNDPTLAWDGDPDGDGRINLFEFALNEDPANPQASGKTLLRPSSGIGNHPFIFTFPARSGAVFSGSPSPSATIDGLVYQVQGSHDLDGFDAPMVETSPNTDGMPALDPGWNYHGFQLAGEDIPSGFFRVHLTSDPD